MSRRALRPEDPDYLLAHAFNDRDVAAVEALYEEGSITRQLPEQGGAGGPGSALVSSLIQAAVGSEQRMNMVVAQVTQVGDVALLRSQWSVTGNGADGAPISINHRGCEITRRQPNGEWKFVIDVPGGADGSLDVTSIPPLPEYEDLSAATQA